MSEMPILIFDDTEDAYWWVLCTEKCFNARGTSEAEKMTQTAKAMRGPALKWWNWWSPHHPQVSWDSFIGFFLWRFKPEYRDVLPLTYAEEEPPPEYRDVLLISDEDAELESTHLTTHSGKVVAESTMVEMESPLVDVDSIKDFDDMAGKEDNPTMDGFEGVSGGSPTSPIYCVTLSDMPLHRSREPSVQQLHTVAPEFRAAGGYVVPPPPPKPPDAHLQSSDRVSLPAESTSACAFEVVSIPDIGPYDPGPFNPLTPTIEANLHRHLHQTLIAISKRYGGGDNALNEAYMHWIGC